MRSLTRWQLNGTEARLEQPVVLRLSRPEVLEELRNSRAGRFLGEIIGPTSVVVKPGAEAKILAALAEIGLLTDHGVLKVQNFKKPHPLPPPQGGENSSPGE